jgi:hypothetical protein
MKTLTAIHYISSQPELKTVVIAGHAPKTPLEAITFLSSHGDEGKWNIKPGTNFGTIIIL